MRIGVTVPNVHETLAGRSTIEAVARMADELGFDSVWCNDHLAMPTASGDGATEPAYAAAYGEQRGQRIYEPLIVLAYLAAVTRRVLLVTSVYLLPLRSPLLAARQAVPLDGRGDRDAQVDGRCGRRRVPPHAGAAAAPAAVDRRPERGGPAPGRAGR